MVLIRILIIVLLCSSNMLSQEVTTVAIDLSAYTNVRDFCINQDGDEAYFTIQSTHQEISQLAQVKKENGIWQPPTLLPFCDAYSYLEPFLSYDQTKLFFVSDRPKTATDTLVKQNFDIWYVQRNTPNHKWSQPIHMGDIVNSNLDEFYPTLSANNNLYFTMDSPNGMGKDDIYVSEWDGNAYTAPKLLGENINSDGYEFNAFIAKDESFLLYTKYNAADGYGSGDLYISRRDKDTGEWSVAVNLGNTINSKYMDYCPFYDSKEHILYFTSRRSSLQAQKFTNIEALSSYINAGANGNSKLYQVTITLE